MQLFPLLLPYVTKDGSELSVSDGGITGALARFFHGGSARSGTFGGILGPDYLPYEQAPQGDGGSFDPVPGGPIRPGE